MNTLLSLNSPELKGEDLIEVSRRISYELNEEGYEASPKEETGAPGEKGLPTSEIGTIVLTLIGAGGVAVNLVNVLNAYLSKTPKLEITFEHADKKLKLTASDTSPESSAKTIRAIEKLLKTA